VFQQPQALPKDRRRRSLPRFPLVDDGFARGADAPGQAALRELKLTTQRPYVLGVVLRYGRQGGRTDLLPAEAAVVRRHELRGGGPRGQSPWSTKYGLDGELRSQSAGSDGRLQCPDVHVKLLGQFAESQQLGLMHVMFDRSPSPEENPRRHSPQSAVPHSKRVQGHGEEFGKVVLREIGGTTQFAQFIHCEHTMPSRSGSVKRPPA
jgi:hypothetical protein